MARRFLGVVGVVTLLLGCVLAEVTEPLLKEDVDNLARAASSAQKSDGTFSSAADAQQAVSVWLGLGRAVPKKGEVCAYLQKVLDSSKTPADIYNCVVGLEKLGCGLKVSSTVKTAVKGGLSNEEATVEDMYFSLTSALALRKSNLLEVSDSDLAQLAPRVVSLLENDGSFATSSADSTTSHTNAGYAYDILGFLLKKLESAKDIESDVASVIDTIKDFVDDNVNDEKISFNDENGTSSLKATAVVAKGANNLVKQAKKKKKSGIKDSHIEYLAEFFLAHKSVANLDEAYYVVAGLKMVSDNFFYVPVVVNVLPRSTDGDANDNNVVLTVTNVMGEYAAPATVLLNSASTRDNDILQSNVELTPVDGGDANTKFKFQFYDSKMENGFFDLDFRVSLEGKKFKTMDSVKRTVKVSSTASITSLEVEVTRSGEGEKTKLKKGKKMSEELVLGSKDSFSVRFSVKGPGGKLLLPQQAFVIFQHRPSGKAVTLVTSPRDKVHHLKLDLTKSATVEAFPGPGEYKITLVVGDALIGNSLVWELADATLDLPNTERANPLKELSVKHEIEHTFNKPDKRPPVVVSMVFTGLCVAPLVISAFAYLMLGANLKGLPLAGLGFINAVLFFGAVVCIFLLFGAFFVYLNIVQTLKLLIPLGAVTAFLGKRALGDIARLKDKVAKKD